MSKYSVESAFAVLMGHDCELAFVDKKGHAYPATLLYPNVEGGVYNGVYKYEIGQDGRQAEMRGTPLYCRAWLADGMWHSFQNACNKAKVNGLEVVCASATPMLLSSIRKGGENCIVSGCNPDFNWQGAPNTSMGVFGKSPWCYAGVHLHASPHPTSPIWKNFNKTIHIIDTICGLGMEAICFDKSSIHRRRFYGRAGCHRPTMYRDNCGVLNVKGLEYRVLGGWCLQNPGLMSLAMGLFKMALSVAHKDNLLEEASALLTRDDVEGAINGCDRDAAVKMMREKVLPFLDDVFADPSKDWWGIKTEKQRLLWGENPIQMKSSGKPEAGRMVYEMALDGIDFFSAISVPDAWGVYRPYISHAGTALGWKHTSGKILKELAAKKG